MKVTLIAAMQELDQGIGKNGEIPWHISQELEHFRRETMDHPVIMGRKTFDDIKDKIGGPLPGRLNIVLTSSESYSESNVVAARNKQAALEAAEDSYKDEVFIAGGGSVYEQFIDEADRMILSHVYYDYDCDTKFPEFSDDEWKVISVDATYDAFEVKEYESSR